MKHRILVALILLCFHLPQAQANLTGAMAAQNQAMGPGDRGGGNVVVCKNDGGTVQSVQLLDYRYSGIEDGIKINLGAPGLSIDEKVEMALKRLGKRDLLLAQDLRTKVAEFNKWTGWVSGADLVPIQDTNPLFNFHGCQTVQIAVQRNRRFSTENIYFVNLDIWNLMDNDSRAGLILHEVIYRKARENGAEDSTGARYFNALIASDTALSELSDHDFYSAVGSALVFLGDTDRPQTSFKGIPVDLKSFGFTSEGQVTEYSPLAPVTVGGQALPAKTVKLYDTGEISDVELGGVALKLTMNVIIDGHLKTLPVGTWTVGFSKSGKLVTGDLIDQVTTKSGLVFNHVHVAETGKILSIIPEDGTNALTNDPKLPRLQLTGSSAGLVPDGHVNIDNALAENAADLHQLAAYPYCASTEPTRRYSLVMFLRVGITTDEKIDILDSASEGATYLKSFRDIYHLCTKH